MQEVLTQLNGFDVYTVLPSNYNAANVTPVVMAIHGSGRSARSYRNSADDASGVDFYAHQRDLAIQNGYIFTAISNGSNTWGLPAGLTNLVNLYNYIQSTYNVQAKWILWATSAGGSLMHQMVRYHPDKVLKCLGTFPVYDLEVEYDILQSCRDAWGTKQAIIDADANPARWPSYLINTEYLIYHGQDDTAVPVDTNSLKLQSDVNALGGNVTVNVVSGGHSTDNWAVYNDTEIIVYLGGTPPVGTWKDISNLSREIDGVWMQTSGKFIKVNGKWEKISGILLKQ